MTNTVSVERQENINHDKLNTWNLLSNDLLRYYGESIYMSWIAKLGFFKVINNTVLLSAPTNFIRDWIKSNYLHTILQLWQNYDSSIQKIEIISNNSNIISNNVPSLNKEVESQDNIESKQPIIDINSTILDPRYTFDNFVVGKSNELAYIASRAVAESNQVIGGSNPLFLYGGVGLGKTHLMHAIFWFIKKNHPSRKVLYMSAEKFMYQFVKALRNKDVISFKEAFRSVDVLMIDDIQFICGKENTQEEFFHTFNTLIDNNRQMVISCDRSPSDLDNIEDRIRSRLGWGLVADVHSTTYELRLGILQSKIEQMDITIPTDVIEFLAYNITSNVRELEGALNKVVAQSRLLKQSINVQTTQEILKDLLRAGQRLINIEDIQKKVAERYNIKLSEISSDNRSRLFTKPRQIAMYLSKTLTSKSLSDIGKKFGKKDHSTVLHAIRKIEELCTQDKTLQDEILSLTRILQG